MNQPKPEELFEFPCTYTFKVIGPGDSSFDDRVFQAISRIMSISKDAVKCRPSSKGKYLSVSVMVYIYNYQQIIDTYAELRTLSDLKYMV